MVCPQLNLNSISIHVGESTYWFRYYFVTSDSMATTSSAWTCRNDECWKLEIVIEWRVKNRSTNLTLLTCRNDECWKLKIVIEWRVKNRSINLTLLTCRNDECWKLEIVIQWPEKNGWIGHVPKRKNISLLSAPIKLNHRACPGTAVDIEPVFSYSLQATSSDV